MPPLKGALSRNFAHEASGILTRVGHGRLLVIGDSSLDFPDKAEMFYYLGNNAGDSSAAAVLNEIATACPLDDDVEIRYMVSDSGDNREHIAPDRNRSAIAEIGFHAIDLTREGEGGFYEFIRGTDPTRPPIYCRTASAFAYDCIAATIGHSQA